ncbi:putative steroid-binding protein 3 [Zostera marina]|uniref:Putative steroid-binding protein 3 n=1 Tax=Zostera marina TaxID=29655 RepID=A0A0K9PWK1_ZOSMR|nr:putative steroid-binding protein 3 [Zostera marina]
MELTLSELKAYDGTDEGKPIYMSVRSVIFDVTAGKNFYGPEGSYCMFAGREVSRALAKMSKNEEDISDDLSGLTEKEIGVLEDWEKKFQVKYPVVGRLH